MGLLLTGNKLRGCEMSTAPSGASTTCGVEGSGEMGDALDNFPNGLNLIEYLNEEEEAGGSSPGSNDGNSDGDEGGIEGGGQLQALYATVDCTVFPGPQQAGSLLPHTPMSQQPPHSAAYPGLPPMGFPPNNPRGGFLPGQAQFSAAPPPFHCQPVPECFPPVTYSQPVYLVPQSFQPVLHQQQQVCTFMYRQPPESAVLQMPPFYQHPQAFVQASVPLQSAQQPTTPVLFAPSPSGQFDLHPQFPRLNNLAAPINGVVDTVPANLPCSFASPPSRSNPSVPSTPSTPSNNTSVGYPPQSFGLPSYHYYPHPSSGNTSCHPTTMPSCTSSSSSMLFPIDVGVAQHAAGQHPSQRLFTPFLSCTPPATAAPAFACSVGQPPPRMDSGICGNNPQSAAVSHSTIAEERRVELTTPVMEQEQQRIPVYRQAYRQDPSLVGVRLGGSTTGSHATVASVIPADRVEQPADTGVQEGGGANDVAGSSSSTQREPDTIFAAAQPRSNKRKQLFPPPTSPPSLRLMTSRGSPDAKRVFVLSSENLAAMSSDPRAGSKIDGGTIKVLRPLATTEAAIPLGAIEPHKKEKGASRKREVQGHSQLAQRIATPEGWDKMNEWLRAADRLKNTERLRTLMSTCLEANITIELLKMSKDDADNSLPKFIQQLSKKSKDSVVIKLATQIVAKWKRLIKESGVGSGASSNKAALSSSAAPAAIAVAPPKYHPQTEANILDQVQEEMDKSRSSTTAGVAGAGPSSSTTAATAAAATTSKMRPTTRASTVKTKMSNRRLTGLEGSDATEASSSKRQDSAPHASAGTNAAPSYLAALRSAGQATAPTASIGISTKREHYKESDMFMDALNQQAATETAAKKSKIVRKKLGTQSSKAAPITPTSSSGSFDTPMPATEGTLHHVDTGAKGAAGAVAEQRTSGDSSVVASKRKRKKVSFVEGTRMVQVRYFDVEEGERVNVTKLSFEEKKQLEMKQENRELSTTFSRSHSRIVTGMPMPPGFSAHHLPTTFSSSSSSRPWKLTLLDDVVEPIERGVNSQSKLIELERQKTALEAFYDWKIVCPISDLDEEDFPHDLPEPPIIPLELTPEEREDGSSAATLAANKGRQTHQSAASIISQLPLPPSAAAAVASTPPMHSAARGGKKFSPAEEKFSVEEVMDVASPTSPESPSREGDGGKGAVRRLSHSSPSSSSSSTPSVVDVSSPDGPQSPEDTDIRHRPADDAPPANVPITATKSDGGSASGESGVKDPLQWFNRVKQSGMMNSFDFDLKGVLNRVQQQKNVSPASSAIVDSAACTSNKQKTKVGLQGAIGGGSVHQQLPLSAPTAGIAAPTTIPQPGVFLSPPSFQSMRTQQPNITVGMGGDGSSRPTGFIHTSLAVPPPGYHPAAIIPQRGVFASPPSTVHPHAQQRSPVVVGKPSAFNAPPPATNNSNPQSGGASSALPPPGLILSLPHIAGSSSSHDNSGQQQPPRSIAACSNSSAQPSVLSTNTALHPPGLEGAADSSGSYRDGISFLPPHSQQQQPSISSASSSSFDHQKEQMPANRTFVKQCTFYQGGGCRFGESCLYAHGEEMTIGVKQAMATVGNTSPPPRSRGGFVGRGGRGGRFGGWGGGGRGDGSQQQLTAIGGGIEISYDEREDRVRAWQIPPTHLMVKGDRSDEDDRGPGRFPSTRGGYRCRGGRGSFHSNFDRYGGGGRGWQRRRSSSRSISPIRTGRRRSRSKSRSRSVSKSRSRSPRRRSPRNHGGDTNDERHRSGRSSRRRRSRSPLPRRDRRETEGNKSPEPTAAGTGRASKRRSNDRSPSPTLPPREGKRRAVRRSPEGADSGADRAAGGASGSRWDHEQQRGMSAEGRDNGGGGGGSRSSRSGSNPQHHALLGEEIVIDCDDDDDAPPVSGGTGNGAPGTSSPPDHRGTRSRRRGSPSASSSSSSSSSGASSTDE